MDSACQERTARVGFTLPIGAIVADTYGVEKVEIAAVMREYFQRLADAEGQGAVATKMGIPRQNLNAILNVRDGRIVQPQHLDAYAASRGVPGSVVLREVMVLCFEMETEAALPPPGVKLPSGSGWVDHATARSMGLSDARPGESSVPAATARSGSRSR